MKSINERLSGMDPETASHCYEQLEAAFNADFYVRRYVDLADADINAFEHYCVYGSTEGRHPRGDFDPAYYAHEYSDQIEDMHPFEHWVLIGRRSGLPGHPWANDQDFNEYEIVGKAFNASYYLATNPDVATFFADVPEGARRSNALVRHFIDHGWKEGRNPNNWFFVQEYLTKHPDVAATGMNPLLHYLLVGRDAGFELPRADAAHETPVDQFMYDVIEANFDFQYYSSQLDSDLPARDFVYHYVTSGWMLGLNPSRDFSTDRYLQKYEDVREGGVNPYFHYITEGRKEGRNCDIADQHPAAPQAQTPVPGAPVGAVTRAGDIYAEHQKYTSAGPLFEELDRSIRRGTEPRAKILAYYLPQFHPIPENDKWWGRGFTEWSNIIRGQPRFVGHRQPRVPQELGFYDLRNTDVIRRQVDLAKAGGVFGFCFYYYCFNGRRILETPIDAFMAAPDIDFPFAIMWANENWTRTWDGFDRSVLLEQKYADADDPTLLADLARHFNDPRYIRINGRPLFFIYRPGHIPNAAMKLAAWRTQLAKLCGAEPLIFMVQAFDNHDPTEFGADGAIEFPPHKICKDMQAINGSLEMLDLGYTGHVVSYESTIERSVSEPPPNFPLIKTASPSWDNEARRPGRGMVLHGSTPRLYEEWMRKLVDFACKNPTFGESFVAVNAWNEWAEGAYLEPDIHFGAAYLNATARAAHGAPRLHEARKRKILIVSHDAYRHGAQLLVKNIAEVASTQFGYDIHIVVCGEGPLLEDYRMLGRCETIGRDDHHRASELCSALAQQGVQGALVNTTVSGWLTPHLKRAGFAVTNLIHELPTLIREYRLEQYVKTIADQSDTIIFPAELVQRLFIEISGPTAGEVRIMPQGLYRTELGKKAGDRNEIKARLGFPKNAKIIINVGYADVRKGFDIFAITAQELCRKRSDVYFVWVGDGTPDVTHWLLPQYASGELAKRLILTGFTDRVEDYYAIADLFYLTSREDPFPSVVIEAMAAGAPLLSINAVCGTNELIVAQGGALVEVDDMKGIVSSIKAAIDRPNKKKAEQLQRLVAEQFRFDEYCFNLIRTVYPETPKISVVVPNYNYERYVESRLDSIFRQTHPVFEIIVLDDCSPDNSVMEIDAVATRRKRTINLLVNEANSGSVFKQWRKGLLHARGDYLWIAEADDDCDEQFLDLLISRMVRDNACLGFSDSWQMDTEGDRLGDSYKGYLNEIEGGAFDQSFSMPGQQFLHDFLSIKNVILNVSSVVFRKDALLSALETVGDELYSYKVAGDWLLYVTMCAAHDAVVSFEQRPLNGHRRHKESVTHSLNNEKHYSEICGMHARVKSLVTVSKAKLAQQIDYEAHVRDYLKIGYND